MNAVDLAERQIHHQLQLVSRQKWRQMSNLLLRHNYRPKSKLKMMRY